MYVVLGPRGVYVGQSIDCFARNEQAILLGWSWGIVHEISDMKERRRIEAKVADAWASRGFAVVSRNTSEHQERQLRAARRYVLERNGGKRRLGMTARETIWSEIKARKAGRAAAAKERTNGISPARLAAVRAVVANRTPQQRSADRRKSWITRRAQHAGS